MALTKQRPKRFADDGPDPEALREQIMQAIGDATPEQLQAVAEALGLATDYDDSDSGTPQDPRGRSDIQMSERRKWAQQTFSKFSEPFQKMGMSRATLEKNAKAVSDADFLQMKEEFAALPANKRRTG